MFAVVVRDDLPPQIKMWTTVGDLSALMFQTDPDVVGAMHNATITDLNELATYQSLMVNGDPSVGLVGSLKGDADEVSLLLKDGCLAALWANDGSLDSCIAFYDGVFNRGLHGAVMQYVDIATAFADEIALNSGSVDAIVRWHPHLLYF